MADLRRGVEDERGDIELTVLQVMSRTGEDGLVSISDAFDFIGESSWVRSMVSITVLLAETAAFDTTAAF